MQRGHAILSPGADIIRWPDLDVELSLVVLLAGRRSLA